MSSFQKQDGGLWKNTKKDSDKKPDATGHVFLTRDMLDTLNEFARRGDPIKLNIAAWTREAKDTGARYQYVKPSVWDGNSGGGGGGSYQKQSQPQQSAYRPPEREVQPDMDDIPF